jgi:Fe-S oxidoreductase
MDPQTAREDIANEMRYLMYDLHFKNDIHDLAQVTADAVYIATGRGGADFGLLSRHDPDALGTTIPGVFLGGMLAGIGIVESIEHGSRASYSIENYLKTGKMDGIASTFAKSMPDPHFYELDFRSAQVLLPEELPDGTEEAARCYLCNCSACMDVCPMLRHFNKYPKAIAFDLVNSVELVQERNKRVLSRLINSCNFCGKCSVACPVGIDNGRIIQESRNRLASSGFIPPVFHEFWLRDMQFSLSEEAYALCRASNAMGSDILFFPGCQLSAALPYTVWETFDFVRKMGRNAAILTGCCGAPAEWAGETEMFQGVLSAFEDTWKHLGEPTVLCACESCLKIWNEFLPSVSAQSLYPWLAEYAEMLCENRPDECIVGNEKTVGVFDPCSGRFDGAAQEAVRLLIAQTGRFQLREREDAREMAACCGFGGHIYVPNPALVKTIAESQTAAEALADDTETITWCANCRDMFLFEEKESRHILEVIFAPLSQDVPDGSPSNPPKRLPSLTERRENRKRLKTLLLSDATAAGDRESRVEKEVIFPEDIERKMDRLLLLRVDIHRLIAENMNTQTWFFDLEKELRIGSMRNGSVTIWAECRMPAKKHIELVNVYLHRMQIIEATSDAGDARSGGETAEENTNLICEKCGESLSMVKARFHYLGHEFFHRVPGCPACGLVFVSEILATGKMSEVETLLEDK